MRLHAKGTSTVGASIESADAGGFIAIASNGDQDRDDERVFPGCFSPLPATVPVHLDHTMRAADIVARGRPYYSGDLLLIDATFDGGADSQDIRRKVADGIIDSLSIVFLGKQWENIDGVRTCVKGELLAADLVSVASNRSARVLSVRGYGHSPVAVARQVARDALLAMARADATVAKSLLAATDPRGMARRRADDLIAEALRGRNR